MRAAVHVPGRKPRHLRRSSIYADRGKAPPAALVGLADAVGENLTQLDGNAKEEHFSDIGQSA